ncbi:hypothetical protein [Rubrivirga sp.]|uniref:hypothetical protein n=1 Tax=Rubrivirga sp. TaxID=1885344 RepID=UPI003B5296FC
MTRAAVLLALALVAGACDDAFEPRVDDGRAFAVFGTLDGRTDRQVLRVQDLTSSVFEVPDRPGVTVSSTELTSGRTTAWRDSAVTLADGVRALVFVATLAVAPGEVHRVDVVRDDGARSTATVRLPAPAVSASPVAASTAARLDLADLGGRLVGPAVRYRVRRPDGTGDVSFATTVAPQEGSGGSAFLVFLDAAKVQATTLLFGSASGDPVLTETRFEGVVVSAEPSPVADGVGGVGWAVPVSLAIPFPVESLTRVGFVDGRG